MLSTWHRSTHWIVLDIDREEKRQTFQQDAIHAWDEYQGTGLHVTGDEVVAWLKTWGDENEQPAPLCHK